MAVHCRGQKRRVQLQDGSISSCEAGDVPDVDQLDLVKAAADVETSRNIDVLLDLLGRFGTFILELQADTVHLR